MDNNFVAVGGLNQMRDYKEEYSKTLEALVELQRELIDILKNLPAPIVITPFVPYTPPYNWPTPAYPFSNPITTGGTHQAHQAHSNVQRYNTVGMGPEFAG